MRKVIFTIFFLFSILVLKSQNKKEWFINGELGVNSVGIKSEFHISIGTEYFFSNKSSFSLRLKYLQTGIYTRGGNNSNSWLNLNPYYKFSYKGNVLSIPFNYKFESHFFINKMNYFFNGGFALNFTLNERFLIAENLNPNYENKTYINFNLGTGFIYKLNDKIDLFLSGEIYAFGGAKTKESVGFIFSRRLKPSTSVLNLGIRYRLKNK